MTLTFNPESYTSLLVRYQPKPLVTPTEYEAAIALASNLEHGSNVTAEEETLLELLVTLIEKYELDHEPAIPVSSGRSVLIHLMDAQDLEPSDLVEVLGNTEVVEQILNGQRSIDLSQARSLSIGKYWLEWTTTYLWLCDAD
jgi:HTH-type transcriptional regulator / antitoxin HigA